MNKKQVRVLLVVGVVIGSVAAGPVIAAVANYLSTGTDFSGSVHVRAPNGPDVTAEGSKRVDDDLLFPNANTVRLITDEGNVTLSSSGRTQVAIPQGGINGTWTNTTNLNVSGADLTINPDDKQAVTVGGDTESFNFTAMQVDDGEVDFGYSGATGTTNVTITGLDPNDKIDAYEAGTNTVLDTARSDQSGNLTLTLPNSKHNVELKESPDELRIYNVSDPDQLVDNATVEITAYGESTTVTRSTNDGTINMSGIPSDQQLVIVAEANGYQTRHVIIDSIYEQQSIYLLNDTKPSVEVLFEIDDPTGEFSGGETQVFVQRPITKDFDGDGDNETKFATVAADEVGVSGFSTLLEQDQRYRIKVRNTDGDVRILGAYTASSAQTITLRPVPLGVDTGNETTYNYTVYQQNVSGTERITFEFADNADATTDMTVAIWEQGNQSHQPDGWGDVTISGPLGSTKVVHPLASSDAETTWVVHFEATRNGETISSEVIVGPDIRNPLTGDAPAWLLEVTALAVIVMTGALFSKLNSGVGAVTTSFVAGGFWWAGFLPPAAGGAVVIVLVVSVLYKIQGDR